MDDNEYAENWCRERCLGLASPELLKSAIQAHHAIRFSYTDVKGDDTTRTVIPYRVVRASDGRAYVHGYCGTRRAKRTFRLDRMYGVEVGSKPVPAEWYSRLCPELLQHNTCGVVIAQVQA
jgi:predicted DNA-binding transcriptional regulator YafY